MACHDVCKVPKGLWCVSVCSDVNVDAAAAFCAALGSSLPKLPDEALQEFDVLVVKDRGYQFAFFCVRSFDRNVSLEFPFAVLIIPCAPGVVAVPVCRILEASGPEVGGGGLCCVASLDVVHLDLNS